MYLCSLFNSILQILSLISNINKLCVHESKHICTSSTLCVSSFKMRLSCIQIYSYWHEIKKFIVDMCSTLATIFLVVGESMPKYYDSIKNWKRIPDFSKSSNEWISQANTFCYEDFMFRHCTFFI